MSDNKLGRPPVEPMSTAAWSRIEKGVFDQVETPPAPPSRARWFVYAGAVAAAAAILLVFLMRRPTEAPSVAASDEPSRVVSGETASRVSFADAHLVLDPHTAIVLTREAAGPSVSIERGSVELVVAPRGGRPPFVVRAADVVVRVVGTQFSVARSDERVNVAVTHGIVDVQYRASVHRVRAGDAWTSATPERVGRNATAAVKPAGDVRAEYERLSALESTDPDAALAGYLVLGKGDTEWAPVALFAAGRLAADRRDPRARALLQSYVSRYPRGANVDDARDLLDNMPGVRP